MPSSDPPWPVHPATFFHSILKSCRQKICPFCKAPFQKNKNKKNPPHCGNNKAKCHLSSGQSLKTVMDAIDGVAVNDCQPHCRPHRCVHPCSWSSHIQNGQGETGLEENTGPPSTIELKLAGGQYLDLCVHLILDRLFVGKNFVNVPVVLKAPARQCYNKLQVSSLYIKTKHRWHVWSLTLHAVWPPRQTSFRAWPSAPTLSATGDTVKIYHSSPSI